MMAPGNVGRRAQTKATTRSKAPAKAGVYFVRAICQLAPRLAASRLTAARLFERLDQSTSRGVGAGAGRTIRLASSAALGELGTRPSPRSPPTAHPPRKGAGARRASISPDRSTVLRDRDQRYNNFLGKMAEIAYEILAGVYEFMVNAKEAHEVIAYLRSMKWLSNKNANKLENIVDEEGEIDPEEITTRVHKCSICHATGHNCRTCPNR